MAEPRPAGDDSEVIIFRHNAGDGKSIEELAEQCPGYTRIYLNARADGGRTILSLSRNSGDVLYILSNRDYPDRKTYLSNAIRSGDASTGSGPGALSSQKARPPDDPRTIKKIKQQSLLNFFSKK